MCNNIYKFYIIYNINNYNLNKKISKVIIL